MGGLDHVVRLVAYNRAVFERFERSVRRRGWRSAIRNREIGHLSLKDTLVHILNVHEAWLVAIAQDRWEVFDTAGRRPAEVRSWSALGEYRDRVWAGEDRLMRGLTERQLRRRVRAPWMPGRYTLEDAFYQVSFEQAYHLGEVIGAYWQQDWPPPPMTWIENMARPSTRR
jgi:uncharacterized damage-inducible protein DinB